MIGTKAVLVAVIVGVNAGVFRTDVLDGVGVMDGVKVKVGVLDGVGVTDGVKVKVGV